MTFVAGSAPQFVLLPFSRPASPPDVDVRVVLSDGLDFRLFEALNLSWDRPERFLALLHARRPMIVRRFLEVMDWSVMQSGPGSLSVHGAYLRLTGSLWAAMLGRPMIRKVHATFDDECKAVQGLLGKSGNPIRTASVVNIYRRSAMGLCAIAEGVEEDPRA